MIAPPWRWLRLLVAAEVLGFALGASWFPADMGLSDTAWRLLFCAAALMIAFWGMPAPKSNGGTP